MQARVHLTGISATVDSMTKLLRINGATSELCTETNMVEQRLREVQHLEHWIVSHPEVLDESMKIVTTQFNRWVSGEDSASERPDIIAITSRGDLVVIELKRVSDRQVHLQALTYAALASSFSLDLLAEEHADWHNKKYPSEDNLTKESAREALEAFIESDSDVDDEVLFALPKIILVAPEFPGQVLTTVQWLGEVAPDLNVECHEFTLFNVQTTDDTKTLVVNFNRVFPVEDIDDKRLRAQSGRVVVAKEQRRKRRRKSVDRILENNAIPDGSPLRFDPSGLLNAASSDAVQAWIAEDEMRGKFSWDAKSKTPLVWAVEPEKRWTPTGLRNELFRRAHTYRGSFNAALAWFYDGSNLSAIAMRAASSEA